MADESTTHLLAAAKEGDAERLGRLLEQYRGYLVMLAHRYLEEGLRRRLDPADIVQLTYLEAQRDLDSFRGTSPAEFAAWMRNILKHNLATAVARHISAKKRSVGREVALGNDSAGADWIAQMPGNTTSPSGRVMREEAALAMLEALHRLPENQAEAVRLRYMEGLPLAEICERLDKSETAVAGLLKRGLCKLRSILVDPHAA